MRVPASACLLALVLLSTTAAAERPATPHKPDAATATKHNPAAGPVGDDRLAETLKGLQEAIEHKRDEIDAQRAELQAAVDDASVRTAQARLESLHREAEELNSRFSRLVAGADDALFAAEPAKAFDPKEKILGLLQPILTELEQLTAGSREISRLQAMLADQHQRRKESADAVASIERALAKDLDDAVRTAVKRRLETWTRRRDEADAQIASIEYELTERSKGQKPLLDSAGAFARRFLRTRGFHLLLGAAGFLGVFLLFGAIRRGVSRIRRVPKERHFSDRLLDLLYRSLTISLAIAAMLFVFNTTGDWFLLGISLIFLIGLGWIAVKAAPQFSQQITLVLNMGSVREGEYMSFEGIPWRVATLGFEVILVNDRLQGGMQRLPVRMIVGMHSRPLAPQEELFPSELGDWVSLDDGITGKVDCQTPTLVRLRLLGGASKYYPTAAFLALNPRNLSGGFRIHLAFGVDYAHQADSTKKIPAAMQVKLTAELERMLEEGELRSVRVEFTSAGASSLDYAVMVDLAGSAAPRYAEHERAIARILVDACNEYGWVIPFQQITLHQADS